jgi:hypothetical protein
MLWKHSMATCIPDGLDLAPEQFIDAQIDNVLHGLVVRSDAPSSAPSPSPTAARGT